MSDEKQERQSLLSWRKNRPARGLRALVNRLPWKQRMCVLALWHGTLTIILLVVVTLIYFTAILPHPMSVAMTSAPVVRIVDRAGIVVSERGKRHAYMPLKLLPQYVLDAVVATEDRRFYEHIGVDPAGLARATLANMRAGSFMQGGSTLTQQLAKNLYLTQERTIARKFEELLLAFWIELRLSKTDILELYLNRVYFGAGAYGIEAAAQRYFGKSAPELSIAEAALLAGLLKAPSNYTPISNPGLARSRARVVLAKMQDAGLIDTATAEAAIAQSVRFADFRPRRQATGFEYAIDYIYEQLPQLSGTNPAEIIVETTLDARLQEAAMAALKRRLDQAGAGAKSLQAAMVVLDMDGGVVAMIGGRSYDESQFNRATQAMRQPGSAFKPFVYLAALEAGLTPASIVDDAPIDIGGWRPKNHDDRYVGRMTLAKALAISSNTAAVRLYLETGADRVKSVAKRLGIAAKLNDDPSLALGTSEVPLLDLTNAYVHFANGGQKVRPHIIRQVRMSSGRIVFARRAPHRGVAIAEADVRAMNTMLAGVVTDGTGKRAALRGHAAAGKTGTTQGSRDAWFIGYTGYLTAGVWAGSDGSEKMPGISGGTLPAEIWRDVMGGAHARLEARPLALLPAAPPSLPAPGTPDAGGPAPDGKSDDPSRRSKLRKRELQVVEQHPLVAETRATARAAQAP